MYFILKFIYIDLNSIYFFHNVTTKFDYKEFTATKNLDRILYTRVLFPEEIYWFYNDGVFYVIIFFRKRSALKVCSSIHIRNLTLIVFWVHHFKNSPEFVLKIVKAVLHSKSYM